MVLFFRCGSSSWATNDFDIYVCASLANSYHFNNKKLKKKVETSVNMKFIWPKIFVSFVVIVAFLTFRSFSTDSFTAVWRYAEVEETIISADVSITSHRCSFGRAADTMMFTMYIAMSWSIFYLFSIRVCHQISGCWLRKRFLANCSHLYYVHSRCESHIINKLVRRI